MTHQKFGVKVNSNLLQLRDMIYLNNIQRNDMVQYTTSLHHTLCITMSNKKYIVVYSICSIFNTSIDTASTSTDVIKT